MNLIKSGRRKSADTDDAERTAVVDQSIQNRVVQSRRSEPTKLFEPMWTLPFERYSGPWLLQVTSRRLTHDR